jgi:hypothetical protein
MEDLMQNPGRLSESAETTAQRRLTRTTSAEHHHPLHEISLSGPGRTRFDKNAAMTSTLRPDLPLVEAHTRAEWRQWLTREHPTSTGVWVVTVKKTALAAALDEQPPARRNFDAFPPSARRGILEWINAGKTPTTRDRRVAETAHLAQQNIRANQWPRR